jgi:hypothetical protein
MMMMVLLLTLVMMHRWIDVLGVTLPMRRRYLVVLHYMPRVGHRVCLSAHGNRVHMLPLVFGLHRLNHSY